MVIVKSSYNDNEESRGDGEAVMQTKKQQWRRGRREGEERRCESAVGVAVCNSIAQDVLKSSC